LTLDFQQQLAEGDGDGFGAVDGADLRQDVVDVTIDAVLTDAETFARP